MPPTGSDRRTLVDESILRCVFFSSSPKRRQEGQGVDVTDAMGQSASQNALSSHTTANKPDCFSDEELNNLKRLFDQLARRSPNATVDLEHFLEFFATLPGLHGDQLFIAFDRKKAGALDFDDFVAGMARVPRYKTFQNPPPLRHVRPEARRRGVPGGAAGAREPPAPRGARRGLRRLAAGREFVARAPRRKKRRSFLDFTNDDVADKAFDECDANHEGKLDLAQFEVWVGKTPGVLEFFDASMAQAVSFGAALNHRSKSDENLAGARKRPSFQNPLMERSSTVTSRDHPAVTGSWFPSDLILPKNDLM
ncbi:Ca2-binding protein [Aureococcus anophagefferens]|nr:Ca2-binding protein [Aureococcus anophagefferens]